METHMVRLAKVKDAEQLKILNTEFNGPNDRTVPQIKESLISNCQEIVIVDDTDGCLTGFICVQLKKSFCYNEYIPEITEVYVRQDYRRRGIAQQMISFAEQYCISHYPLDGFELLTGTDNHSAQSVYNKLGYHRDGEIHMSKS